MTRDPWKDAHRACEPRSRDVLIPLMIVLSLVVIAVVAAIL